MKVLQPSSRYRRFLVSVAATCLFFLWGCYVYVPVDLSSPGLSQGEQVRVYVQVDAARRMSLEAGRTVRQLEGRLLETNRDSIRVSVLMARGPQGSPVERIRQVFAAASSEVLELQRAELSRRRTGLLGAVIVAGLVVTISQIRVRQGGGTPEQPPSFPEAPTRLPVPAPALR